MKRITLAVLSFAISIVFVEMAARVVSTISNDIMDEPKEWGETLAADVGWELKPNYHGRMYCGRQRAFDANGFIKLDSDQIAGDTRKRMIFLGDSHTFGYCVDHDRTFTEIVDNLHPELDAINIGINGYTSYQGYQRLLKYEYLLRPHTLIVSFNWNDRRYVLDEAAADSANAFQSNFEAGERKKLRDWLRKSYIFRAVASVLTTLGVAEPEKEPKSSVALDELQPRVSIDKYRENLMNIVHWAKDQDSNLIFLVLGDNPVRTAHLRSGINLLESGQYELAIADFKVAMRDKAFGNLARLYLARAYRGLGLTQEAQDVLTIDPLLAFDGGNPIHLDTEYIDVMLEVATKEHVHVTDAREVLNQTPGDFIDESHFDAAGHLKVAKLLSDKIGEIEGENGGTITLTETSMEQ